MIQLARTKKIKRKKIYQKKYQKKLKKHASSFWEPLKKIKLNLLQFLWPLFILLLVVSWVTIVLQKTVFDTTNYISKIQYVKTDIQEYDNPYLYNKIESLLTGKNIYKLNYFWDNGILSQIKQDFPIVKDLSVSKLSLNTAAVKLDFFAPQIIFQIPTQERRFWVWWEKTLEIFSGNTIANNILTIYLPQYANWIQNIDGIFFDIPAKQLLSDLYQINKSFPQASRIVYMPWSKISVIFVYGKTVYISHQHDIMTQLKKFYALESYYTWFQNLKILDLWSLEDGQSIVK